MLFLCGFYELVCVRGAGAVRVARDELVAFVVHRVAQSARQRHQEANERDAVDEDAAWEVEAFAGRNFWEQSIVLGAGLGCFVVRGGRAGCVRSWTSCRTCYRQTKDEDEPHNHAR